MTTKKATTTRKRARKSHTTPTTINQPSMERELEQIDESAVEEARKVLDLITYAPPFIRQALTVALDGEGTPLREASGDFSLIAVARAFERRHDDPDVSADRDSMEALALHLAEVLRITRNNTAIHADFYNAIGAACNDYITSELLRDADTSEFLTFALKHITAKESA
jgi:hypothetical protein